MQTEFKVWQYKNSITKRKILQLWRRDKQKFLRSLISEDHHTNQFAVQFYQNFKSLLYQSYSEEYPHHEPNIHDLYDWITSNANICKQLANKRDEQTWLDLRRCTRILIDGQLT